MSTKHPALCRALLAFCLFSCFCLCAECAGELPKLVQKVKPAVVTIYVFDEDNKMINQGSGFFLSSDLVVTCRHVVLKKGASHAKVITNGKPPTEYAVKSVVVDDSATDLVALAIDRISPTPQTVVNVSLDEVFEGEDVFVISSPADLKGVVTSGIVSAIHNKYDLQISCPISTGSSGAPVFNYNGQVIGVVYGHFKSGQNLNFAISMQGLKDLFEKLGQSSQDPIVPRSPNEEPQVIPTTGSGSSSSSLMLPSSPMNKLVPREQEPKSGNGQDQCYLTISEWIEINIDSSEENETSRLPTSLVDDILSGLKSTVTGLLGIRARPEADQHNSGSQQTLKKDL